MRREEKKREKKKKKDEEAANNRLSLLDISLSAAGALKGSRGRR